MISVNEAFKKLETNLDPKSWSDIPPGWADLIIELHEKLYAINPKYYLSQVKEKFGGLRYHFSPGEVSKEAAHKMFDLETEYETKSFRVCSFCGSTDSVKQVVTSWIYTLCKPCCLKELKLVCNEDVEALWGKSVCTLDRKFQDGG